MVRIDLNCDLGEGAGHDVELMPFITSANIACGLHAGDAETMRATVQLALRHGVAIGAHPSLNDRENFGRKEIPVTPEEVRALVLSQTQTLQEIAKSCGARVVHVKPHGALYNLAARDVALAEAVASAVLEADPALTLFALAGSKLSRAGEKLGLRVASEVFADRTYQADGSLTPRSRSDALVATEGVAVEQVKRMIFDQAVIATDGVKVSIVADTVCLHGDGAHAVAFAEKINDELRRAGVELKAFTA
ncbi:5-oxoprolinase subunit PxpA [Oleiharenicola lentus]|uniref:5-oxoprolinase subunit PxpA n=1 Tax=Oleiharenicola lentus TaxID=2508720 RepID=UPI003F668510